jgi:uncharacterized protein YjbI with pentapeptide repeats
VLHYPGKDKVDDFREAIDQKLAGEDNAFQAVYFPLLFPNTLVGWLSSERLNKRARFAGATFEAGASFFQTTFDYAGFTGATFKGATDFRGVTFNEGVYFDHVTFEEVHFSEANYEVTFKDNVSFFGSTFTKAHFQNAIFEKDAYFNKTVVGEGNFSKARFENETTFGEAAFEGWVTFSDATFKKRASLNDVAFRGLTQFADTTFLQDVTFERAVFSDVTDFSKAKFCAASIGTTDFSGASFKGLAYFFDSTFGRQALFNDATFEAVTFEDVTFSEEAYFTRAIFKSEAYFRGRRTFSRVADFQFARIEKPEVFSFHSARLRPSWFVNVDPRKFDFTEVQWPERPGGPKVTLDDEISSLQERGVQNFYNPYILLSQVCRRLSANAEENHEYPLANEFHYWSMDALRIGRGRYLGWLRQYIEKNWQRISARFGLMATLLWIWRICWWARQSLKILGKVSVTVGKLLCIAYSP